MNPTRRSLLVSGLRQRVRSKPRRTSSPPRAAGIETRVPASKEKTGSRRYRPDFKIRKVTRFDSGSRGEAVSSPGLLGHHAAPDRVDRRDQGRKHLLLFRFQGGHSRRGPASRTSQGVRGRQDGAEGSRQGLASAPDRACDRGASDGAARSERFHLGQYSHLRTTPEHLKKPHRPLRRAYARYWDQLFLDARRAGKFAPISRSSRCGYSCWAR